MSLLSWYRSLASRVVLGLMVAALAVACGKEDPVIPPPPPPPPVPPPPPPPTRTIGVAPATITFTDTLGTANPAPVEVTISSTGQAGVGAVAVGSIQYDDPSTAGWLTHSLSGTAAPAKLTLQPSLTGMTAGTFTAVVPLSADSATNNPQTVTVTFNVAARPPQPPDPPPTEPPPAPIPGVVIAATGNIGRCGSNGQPGDLNRRSANVVAALNPDYVFVLGDVAYPPSGSTGVTSLDDFMRCYDPTWGQFKTKTYAAVGGREQDSLGFSPGSDAYFGAERVGQPGDNWYSFNVGSWHIIVLNVLTGGRTLPNPYNDGSPQLTWLRDDLAANAGSRCTMVMWHDPMWYSSDNESTTDHNLGVRRQPQRGIWKLLYEFNVDVALGGGDHIYERFAPMRYYDDFLEGGPEFRADSVRGIRQITTGLGGDGSLTTPQVKFRHPLSVYRSGGVGVLKMTLGDGVYTWQFMNGSGSNVQDWGSGSCH